jgi:hypothetical protein
MRYNVTALSVSSCWRIHETIMVPISGKVHVPILIVFES